MKIYNDCHDRMPTCTFIYTKIIKNCETFLYSKSLSLYKKLDNVRYLFFIQKAINLTLGDFHEIFEVGVFIQKALHFALRDVFIYEKLDTSRKARQFAKRFYIQTYGTFELRDFSLNF